MRGSGITSKNMNLISCREGGTYQVTLPIWMKMDTSGSKGRIDDVIMTSGERVGPFEVESKLIEHGAVAEAGVIGIPDPVRGEIIKAFIALRAGYEPSDELKKKFVNL